MVASEIFPHESYLKPKHTDAKSFETEPNIIV
jgi:hypothetical protein